ncbi:MAG: hypothetical protein N2747_11225 [Chitinophagaceae bacterium]|nr:hypothetical protein [Chitinophagaceae bacterium]
MLGLSTSRLRRACPLFIAGTVSFRLSVLTARHKAYQNSQPASSGRPFGHRSPSPSGSLLIIF